MARACATPIDHTAAPTSCVKLSLGFYGDRVVGRGTNESKSERVARIVFGQPPLFNASAHVTAASDAATALGRSSPALGLSGRRSSTTGFPFYTRTHTHTFTLGRRQPLGQGHLSARCTTTPPPPRRFITTQPYLRCNCDSGIRAHEKPRHASVFRAEPSGVISTAERVQTRVRRTFTSKHNVFVDRSKAHLS